MKLFFIFFLFLTLSLHAQNDWQTWYEKSGFNETPRYQETIDFCKRLAEASPQVQYQSFGRSPQGRDLPLLVVNKNGLFTPEAVHRSDQIVFYIQAGIHPGESDGKDAGLMLIRDLIIENKYPDLLDHVTVLFNPIFNVDGHERFGPFNRANQNGPKEMGWRVTAQNLNLNRDYLKADTPEMQAFLQLYNHWLPDFFADCHVTDGADYQYAISYSIDQQGIQQPNLIHWTQSAYLPQLQTKMQHDGFPLTEYVFFRNAHDVESGMVSWAAAPRFSNGYTPIQNRLGLLIETHMLKSYKIRVTATYDILLHTLEILNEQAELLKQEIALADRQAASSEFRKHPFTLTYRTKHDSTMIDFLGYAYDKVKSELSGGIWYRFHPDQPKTFHIPFFNKMEPAIQVQLPEAYIIPVEWNSIISRLSLHGIHFKRLHQATRLPVQSYRFQDVRWQKAPYEGRQIAQFKAKPTTETRLFPAGSVVIDMNQRSAKVIANILEPVARDSYVYWGVFNAIFEQKEYVESYVMETYARLMLASDKDLKNAFTAKMKSDSTFAASPSAILKWFYERSPYWDSHMNRYPVGRIMNRTLLEKLDLK